MALRCKRLAQSYRSTRYLFRRESHHELNYCLHVIIDSLRLWKAFSIVLLGLFGWYVYFFVFFVVKGSDSLGAVLAHVLTGSPLIWLAWYLQKSIAQQSQIRQEYNHKQRVMTMYEGFVKAIDESGSKAHKEELLSIMLKTVQSNPADILNGHDTLIDSIASKASKIPSLFKENISEESKKDV